MPGYKAHLFGGIVVFALILLVVGAYCANIQIALAAFACCLAGSLFPDIDIKSKGQKYFYAIIMAVIAVTIIKQRYDILAIVSIASVVPMLARHRGLFHEPWFLTIFPLSIWIVLSNIYKNMAEHYFICTLFFIGGAFSHLFLDRGVRGIVPRKRKRFFK